MWMTDTVIDVNFEIHLCSSKYIFVLLFVHKIRKISTTNNNSNSSNSNSNSNNNKTTMVPLTRVAVVTGANKGIGYFIALQLAVSGLFTDVIIGCRDSSRGAIASEEIQQKISIGSSSSTKMHSLPLIIGNVQSHTDFCERLEQEFGSVSVLVNNAGFAYKGSDPTPFNEQTKKTFETNYYGLVDFTEKMIPLLKKGEDPRLVNVASMAGKLKQLSSELQAKYTDEQLTIEQLNSLMKSFEKDVHDGVHRQNGWSSSNYGR